jgi:DNA polymerase
MTQPYKRILTIDYETRWSSKPTPWSPDEAYTLSKLTTEEYIRDTRFKAFGACVHELGSGAPIQWYSHVELPRILATYDWSETAVLAHNAQFDVAILSFIYGIKPCFIFDSLSMGRALRGVEVGNSLAKLAAAFGLPPKGQAVHSTDGLEEITWEIEKELAAYCGHDVYLCEEIFSKLLLGITPEGTIGTPYPKSELRLISMTIKMFTEPMLVLDADMLQKAKSEDENKLFSLLCQADVDESDLASNDKFAELLAQHGVAAPMKTSKQTGQPALALAKTDALFQAMLNGDNEDVALLCQARLRVKSTGERTRAQRFIGIASRGPLPVPLNYYGAGTGRYAAGGKINLQNLKRGSYLRKAIMAPEGHQVIAGDLSQIEPRVLAWLSDYDELLNIFRSGGDPYATFGAQMFNIPGLTKESHPLLRQSAKSGMLGAGYQLGWASFAGQLLVGFLGAPPQRYTMADAKQLGVTKADVTDFLDNEEYVRKMNEIAHTCTDQELLIHCLAAKAIIDKYRTAAAPIVQFWDLLGNLITHSLIAGNVYQHKCLTFKKGEIVLANGMSLLYPDIQIEQTKKGPQYHYAAGAKRVKLYPGKVCNNVTQGTARIVMTDGMLRVDKRFPVKGTVHDELLAICPDAEVKEGVKWVKAEMIKVPKWMPGIPLNADVGASRRYGDAKK